MTGQENKIMASVRVIGDVVGYQFSATTNGKRTVKRLITNIHIERQPQYAGNFNDEEYYWMETFAVGTATWRDRELTVRYRISKFELSDFAPKWYQVFETYNPKRNAELLKTATEREGRLDNEQE